MSIPGSISRTVRPNRMSFSLLISLVRLKTRDKIYLKPLKVKRIKRTLTKQSMVFRGFRMSKAEAEGWLMASAVAGVSRSEFVRSALREKVGRTLIQSDQRKENEKVINE